MPVGLIGCFLLCIILGACEAFTMYVLSKFAERYQAPTYSGLIRKALGRKLSASERSSSQVDPYLQSLWAKTNAWAIQSLTVHTPLSL